MNPLAIILITMMGVLFFSIYATSSSLPVSQMNKLEALDISSTAAQTLMEVDLGTSSTIDSVLLTFRNNLPVDTTVSISIKNTAGSEIGSGSKVLSVASSTVTITLSNTITDTERPTLRELIIT